MSEIVKEDNQSFGSFGSFPPLSSTLFSSQEPRRTSFRMSLGTLEIVENKRKVSIVKPQDQGKKVDQLTLVPKRIRCAVSFRADDTDKWGAETMDEREDYSLMLKDPSLRNDLLERLNTFRCNRELCDVVLFVREREIFAHKVVLAAVSPALFDMFLNGEPEENGKGAESPTLADPAVNGKPISTGNQVPSTKHNMDFFEFAQTDFECFNALVNFAYTAYLEISSKKVAELYKTAFSLQMTPVVKACATFLADNLNVKNCIGVRRQANFNNDTYLLAKVDRFLQEEIARIVDESVEFTQLPCVKTRIIVPLEDLRNGTRSGSNLAELALEYFDHLPHERAEHSLDLLTCKTHLLYMEEDERLADCAEMDDRSSVGSCDIIQDYKRSGKDVAKNLTNVTDAVASVAVQHRVSGAVPVRLNASRMPNVKYSSTESLNSVGSDDTDTTDTIETRLIASHQTSPDYWVALVVLYRRLVALSIQLTDDEDLTKPRSNSNGTNSSDKNTLLSRLISCTGTQRQPLAPMSGPRCSVGAVFLNGKIIVCGGYDRGECLRTVEEYDVVAGEWRPLQAMKNERGRFDSAVLNGKVYAIAGSNGNHDLKTAEVFDYKTNKWEVIPSISKARSHNGCAALEGYIYCIGGSSDQIIMKDCERYKEGMDAWETIPFMENARYQAGVIAWRGLIVAVGGCDRWSCMDSVEAYDPKTNSWRQLSKLRIARRGCAVAVVRDTLYVIGGHDGQQSLTSVEILDNLNGSWRPGPPLTTARANTHAVVTAGNVIYAIGGFNGILFLNTIELLETELVGWRNWQQSGTDPLKEEDEEKEPEDIIQNIIQQAVEAQ